MSLQPAYKQAKGSYPNLHPGEAILLDKRSMTPVTHLLMGLGWEPLQKPEEVGFLARKFSWVAQIDGIKNVECVAKHFRDDSCIDLDASCILLNNQYEIVETVFFRNLISSDGSVRHSGDNLTGEGDGDDEAIMVDFTKMDKQTFHLVFVITSFSGQTFDVLANAYCRVVDQHSHKELGRVRLQSRGKHTALIMARLTRSPRGWIFQSIDVTSEGKTYEDILPDLGGALEDLDVKVKEKANSQSIWGD